MSVRHIFLITAVFLLTLCFCAAPVSAAWDGSTNTTSWYEGNESVSELFIYSETDLAGLAVLVNDGESFTGKNINLMDNLDLNESEWTPIGVNSTIPFSGSFDGGGYTISNLYIYNTIANYQGLFGYVSGGSISNVNLTDVNVTGSDNVGGLVGYASGSSSIENSYATGFVNGGNYIGGLVGEAVGSSSITNSYAIGNVTGNIGVGGLVGSASGTITNSYATGFVNALDNNIGGLVGRASGTITNSYATGFVNGSNYVGGLAGYADGSGSIENSYATGSVNGNSIVGGLVGRADGTITNSYATGNVTITGGNAGGLVGSASDGTIITNSTALNRYVNGGSGNVGRVLGGSSPVTFENNFAWEGMQTNRGDFNSVWNGEDTTTAQIWNATLNTEIPWYGFTPPWEVNQSFTDYLLPVFEWQTEAPDFNASYLLEPPPQYFIGNGTALNPFNISSASDLANLSHVTNHQIRYGGGLKYSEANYTVTADIDLSGYHTDEGWTPIGMISARFSGSFDGGGHTISNLYIYNPSADDQGLFGYVSGGSINNVSLTDVSVTGRDGVGGLAGQPYGSSISNVSLADVNVTGDEYVGGLAGYAEGSSISNVSLADVNVTGEDYVGGLAGYVWGSLTNSYATGTANGDNYVGGLAGQVIGSIDNSHAAGFVNGDNYVGGLAGLASGSIENSYAAGSVTGEDSVGGLVGMAGMSIITNSTALNSYVNGSANVSRILGCDYDNATVTGSYAWDGMKATTAAFNETEILHGMNISSEDVWNTFPSAAVWSGWDTSVWKLGAGERYRLPILVGLPAPAFDASYLAPVLPVFESGADDGGELLAAAVTETATVSPTAAATADVTVDATLTPATPEVTASPSQEPTSAGTPVPSVTGEPMPTEAAVPLFGVVLGVLAAVCVMRRE